MENGVITVRDRGHVTMVLVGRDVHEPAHPRLERGLQHLDAQHVRRHELRRPGDRAVAPARAGSRTSPRTNHSRGESSTGARSASVPT